jgi:hypothetical protein
VRVAFVFLALGLAATITAFALLLLGAAGVVTSIALFAIAFAVKEFFDPRFDASVSWSKGANAEQAVGDALTTLRREGYVVMHDLDKVVAGNIDHLVSGPTGVFMIETKFKRYLDPDIPKAKRVAKQVAHELGIAWVQPVICCATRSYGPRMVNGVAVLGRDQLLSYVRAQKKPVVDFDRLAAFADRQ